MNFQAHSCIAEDFNILNCVRIVYGTRRCQSSTCLQMAVVNLLFQGLLTTIKILDNKIALDQVLTRNEIGSDR